MMADGKREEQPQKQAHRPAWQQRSYAPNHQPDRESVRERPEQEPQRTCRKRHGRHHPDRDSAWHDSGDHAPAKHLRRRGTSIVMRAWLRHRRLGQLNVALPRSSLGSSAREQPGHESGKAHASLNLPRTGFCICSAVRSGMLKRPPWKQSAEREHARSAIRHIGSPRLVVAPQRHAAETGSS